MGTITATFVNDTDQTRECVVIDQNILPEQVVFDAVLQSGASTPALSFDTGNDVWGKAAYQVAGGGLNVQNTVNDGDVINMK